MNSFDMEYSNSTRKFVYASMILFVALRILRPRNEYAELFYAGSFLFFCLITIVVKGIYINKRNLLIFLMLLYVFCIASYKGSISSGLNYMLSFLFMISPILVSDVFLFSGIFLKKEHKSFLKVILSIFLYCIFVSFMYLKTDVMAIRNMASEAGEIEFAYGIVGGGYPLVFSVAVFIPVALYWFKYQVYNVYAKVLCLTIWILLILFLLRCDVTIAFVVSLLFCFPVLFVRDRYKFLFCVGLTIIVTFFAIIYMDQFLAMISEKLSFLDSEAYIAIRLKEFISGDTSFGGRIPRIIRSLDTISKYPFFGAGVRIGFDYYSLEPFIGSHSDFFDIPAKYGLLFTAGFYWILYDQFKKIKNNFDGKESRMYTVLFVLIIIISVLDPVLNTNALLVFYVIIPSLLLKSKDEKNILRECNGI